MAIWLCRMKKAEGNLTKWDQQKLSEQLRNLAMSYNLEYVIITKTGN
jgi:hypothetical protein